MDSSKTLSGICILWAVHEAIYPITLCVEVGVCTIISVFKSMEFNNLHKHLACFILFIDKLSLQSNKIFIGVLVCSSSTLQQNRPQFSVRSMGVRNGNKPRIVNVQKNELHSSEWRCHKCFHPIKCFKAIHIEVNYRNKSLRR